MSQILIEKQAGADYSQAGAGVYPPVTDGLVGWYYFGIDGRQTVQNHAAPGACAHIASTPVYASGGAESLSLSLPNSSKQFTGDTTLIAVFQPGDAGSDLGHQFVLGSEYQVGALRYGIKIAQRTFNGDSYDVLMVSGTYDGGPSSSGTDNTASARIDDIDPTQIVFAIGRYNAATRVSSIKLRNGAALATPRSGNAAAAPSGHIRDLRNNLGMQAVSVASSGARAYFGALYTKNLSATEEDALYLFIAARLAERGVSGL